MKVLYFEDKGSTAQHIVTHLRVCVQERKLQNVTIRWVIRDWYARAKLEASDSEPQLWLIDLKASSNSADDRELVEYAKMQIGQNPEYGVLFRESGIKSLNGFPGIGLVIFAREKNIRCRTISLNDQKAAKFYSFIISGHREYQHKDKWSFEKDLLLDDSPQDNEGAIKEYNRIVDLIQEIGGPQVQGAHTETPIESRMAEPVKKETKPFWKSEVFWLAVAGIAAVVGVALGVADFITKRSESASTKASGGGAIVKPSESPPLKASGDVATKKRSESVPAAERSSHPD